MQEAAKAKEAAKRAREAEVFILNPQGAPTTHTIPKPFNLHDNANQVHHFELNTEQLECLQCNHKLEQRL